MTKKRSDAILLSQVEQELKRREQRVSDRKRKLMSTIEEFKLLKRNELKDIKDETEKILKTLSDKIAEVKEFLDESSKIIDHAADEEVYEFRKDGSILDLTGSYFPEDEIECIYMDKDHFPTFDEAKYWLVENEFFCRSFKDGDDEFIFYFKNINEEDEVERYPKTIDAGVRVSCAKVIEKNIDEDANNEDLLSDDNDVEVKDTENE